MNWNNLVIKFDGSKDGATPELVTQFDQLPYRRLTLLQAPQPGIASAVVVERYTPDGLQQFAASMRDVDLAQWLNTGKVGTNRLYEVAKKLLVIEP